MERDGCRDGVLSAEEAAGSPSRRVTTTTMLFGAQHAECPDAVSDDRSSELCLIRCNGQGPFIGHIAAGWQYRHQSTGARAAMDALSRHMCQATCNSDPL